MVCSHAIGSEAFSYACCFNAGSMNISLGIDSIADRTGDDKMACALKDIVRRAFFSVKSLIS
jgi:hypothetical protein